ncbi:hypothetical protein FOHLNKBM_5966 [Methylobacterium longum]|nr:hypothetical protein FOHLNKBM_5966 [Methylobacterium longum]
MSRARLAMGLAGFVVAFVSVVGLKSNGYPNALVIVLGAAILAGIVVAVVVAKWR